jgi:hypothetical protein
MNSTTPLLLAAWSTTTTAREKFQYRNNQPYKDTPRSRYESMQVAFASKAVQA